MRRIASPQGELFPVREARGDPEVLRLAGRARPGARSAWRSGSAPGRPAPDAGSTRGGGKSDSADAHFWRPIRSDMSLIESAEEISVATKLGTIFSLALLSLRIPGDTSWAGGSVGGERGVDIGNDREERGSSGVRLRKARSQVLRDRSLGLRAGSKQGSASVRDHNLLLRHRSGQRMRLGDANQEEKMRLPCVAAA